MTDEVAEDQCAVCSGARGSERALLRLELDSIPLKQPVCDACVMAFFRNIGFPVSDNEANKD